MIGKIIKAGKFFCISLLAVLFLSGFFVFARHDVLAQSSASDAIAVRVIANPEHLSPLSWYQGKGFSGSPSPITVDGYQAIQDGRTVYVNVANVDPDTNKFYTNIYLISYNQNASADTSEIFSRILSNWKFNTNLTVPGYCFAACTTDNDCPAGSSCNATRCQQDCQKDADCSAASSCLAGHCRQSCLEDSDCGSNSFCDSQKANVIRDTVRLAEINDLKAAIEASQKRTGHYPLLTSGTFIPGQTISTWPSWKGEFASELGKSVPLDPINRLGYCDPAIYDPATCWDAAGQSLPPDMSIPDGLFNSSVFAYAVADQGKSYHACAVMQSGFLIGYDDDACPGSVSNIPAPTISCGTMVGLVDTPFTGYVKISGTRTAPLIFSIPNLPPAFNFVTDSDAAVYSSNDSCQADFTKIIAAVVKKRNDTGKLLSQITGSTWSAEPCFPDAYPQYYSLTACDSVKASDMADFGFTASDFGGASFVFDENEAERGSDVAAYCVPDTVTLDGCGSINLPFYNTAKCQGKSSSNTINYQAIIYSSTEDAGNYPITISVTDNKGVATTKTCTINISAQASVIYPLADQRVQVGHNVTFDIYAVTSKKNYAGLNFKFQNAPAGFVCGPVTVGADGRAKCTVNYPAVSTFNKTGIIVSATDSAGDSFTSQQFNLEISDDPPVVQSLANCKTSVRVNNSYPSCKITAVDPNGDKIAHIDPASALPAGMTLATNGSTMGTLSGTPTVSGVYNLSFTATDLYGATGQPQSFTLNVNTYCGDKVKESPNMENAGGSGKNGYEDCDGAIPIPTPAKSNTDNQYSFCNADCSIKKNGFCGDGIAQDGLLKTRGAQETIFGLQFNHAAADFGEQCDFGGDINCCNTCQWTTAPFANVAVTPTGNTDLGSGQVVNFAFPPNRGVKNIQFTAVPDIITNDFSKYPIAIVVASDISNPPDGDITIGNIRTAVAAMINQLYNNLCLGKNEDVFVGAFGFGGGDSASVSSHFHYEVSPGNLRDPAVRSNLTDEISLYVSQGDEADDDNFRSGIDLAIPEAQSLLDAPELAGYNKYLILMSDGCSCNAGWDALTQTAATTAKNDPNGKIKIYTVAYDGSVEPPITGIYSGPFTSELCGWSSDNGDASKCYYNPAAHGGADIQHYAYGSASDGSDISGILDSIQADIESGIPQDFSLSAAIAGGGTVSSGKLSVVPGGSVPVTLNLAGSFICGIDGLGCDKSVSLGPLFDGIGEVGINNLNVSLLPACQP